MQLEVKPQELKPVDWNYEQLKKELKESLEKYQNLVVIEEDLPKYKSDKATLNNLKKALNSKRVQIKKEFSAPIQEFEDKVKELVGMIDEPINCLDDQLKKFEEKRRELKRDKIEALFNEINDIDQIKFNMVFQDQWLNVAVSIKKITEEITAYIDKIHGEIQAITDLKSDHEELLHDLYLRTFDLPTVLRKKKELDDAVRVAEERRKAQEEAERKRKEAAEIAERERIEREKQAELDRIEREKKAEIEAKENELRQREIELQKQAEAIRNNDPLPVEEKTPIQKLAESQNPELNAINNVEPQQIDFRVWVTPEQKILIRDFLVSNGIQFGKVK